MSRLGRHWQTFAGLFGDSRQLVAGSIAVAVAQSVSLVPIALIVRHVFDSDIPGGHTGALVGNGALVLALFATNGALGLWSRYWILRANKRAITELRVKLVAKLYSLPRAYFDRADVGVLHATLIQDTERLDVMANALMAQALPAFLITTVLLVAMAYINPFLTVLLVAVTPLLAFLARRIGRAGRVWAGRYHADYDTFAAHAQVGFRAMTLTKALGAEELEVAARRREAEALEGSSRTMSWLLAAYAQTQSTIAAIAGVIVLIVGGAAVSSGSMSLGSLLGFYAVVALLRAQLLGVLSATPNVVAGADSMTRVQAVLDASEAQPYSGEREIEWTGAIALEGVRFGYRDRAVVDGIDLRVEPGERVVLAGPNGAGKSTILYLLLGLYRPWQGRALAGGVPFDELDLNALRQRIGVVLQDPIVFRGSVLDNVRYGRPGAGETQVRRALELAGAASFVAELPDGLETQVGDEGGLLSGGQRQRLAVARALVREPRLLILDEPSVHLDQDGLLRLLETLANVASKPGILIVTHDEALFGLADRICHLDRGRLVPAPLARPSPVEVGADA
jgi:ABC-type multidrug transport system fused ATPase/permease subunit